MEIKLRLRTNILHRNFYGEMLTEKQREYLDYYYNDDLSLSEIANNIPYGEKGRSRQAVRDVIKRAEAQLIEMEEKLGLVKRFVSVQEGLNEIIECAEVINKTNLNFGLSREINDAVIRIKAIAGTLAD